MICHHSWNLSGKNILRCSYCKITNMEEIFASEFTDNCYHSWILCGKNLYNCSHCKITINKEF